MNKETQQKSNITGILMPLIAYRFRVRLEADKEDIVGAQTVNVTMDYLERTVSLNLRQGLQDTKLHELIMSTAKDDHILYVDALTGKNGDPAMTMEYHVKMIDHKFRLDYASDEVAIHELVFSIL